jgi:sigma-E factor negative regulatory protein RseC
MKNRLEGFVLELQGDTARVRLSVHGSCSSCGSCGGEGASFIDAKNACNAQPGQNVIVEINEQNTLKSAFIIYLLPLCAPIFGYIVGYYISRIIGKAETVFSASTAFVFFAAALVFIRYFDKKMHAVQTTPVVVAIKQ